MNITEKQQRFVEEYLIDLNATKAAIRAGYSPKTADVQGPRLLGKVRVSCAIARAKAERSRRTGITQDRILQELARIAFLNPVDVLDLQSCTLRSDVSKDDLSAVSFLRVKKVSAEEGGTYKELEIKFYNKLKALELLGKHLGLFEKNNIPSGSENDVGVIILPAVMEASNTPEYIENQG